MSRYVMGLVMASALGFGLECGRVHGAENAKGGTVVYVGTYTGSGSKGIYRLDLDPATGALSEPRLAAETVSPSFLAIHPTGRFLYAVGEVDVFDGQKGGGVAAFALDPKTGNLTSLNARPSGGAGPCHLVVDRAGKNVLVANYGGGITAVLPVGPDGRLGERSAFVQHRGSSVNLARQKEPHAHSVNLDAANRFAVVADLGLDKMLVYRFDPAAGTITPNDPPSASLAPGAGPRHFAFHPSGKTAYTINELNSTVTAWAYDADKGVLREIQTISSLPAGFTGTNYPADVQVHPSGKFVYGSNRGHDSIVAYTVDPGTGHLTLVGHQGHKIKNPRNFGIDPSGRFMLVASQDANTVQSFRIDQNTGALTPTGSSVTVAKPVCVKFWTPAE
jgi:6-phosphogluconolactonase